MGARKPTITKKEIQEKLSYDQLVEETERLHGRDDRHSPEVRSVRREILLQLSKMEQERAKEIYREEAEGKRPPGQHISNA